jgi:bifunctional oligoribonuclease and PAP phosphatase NrnA
MIEGAAEVLRRGQRFVVTSHLNPDGDALGSMLAVVHLLRDNGKEAIPFHCDPVPGPFLFLPGADEVTADLNIPGPFDALVVVDVGERDRVPAKLPVEVEEAKVLVIDHHQQHGDYGDVVWRRRASAVGEMMVELARYLEWEVSIRFAECAYTAILTDTGSFRYSSTTAESLSSAAFLLGVGVQPWKVASAVYESWPDCRVRLLGDVLSTLRVECEGRYASLVVLQSMLAARGATVDMSEGFVNEGRRIAGVEVSALFRERGPDRFRVSFRSRGRVDVSQIALQLDGGGHKNAAGGTAQGPLEDVRARVAELVERALAQLASEGEDFELGP